MTQALAGLQWSVGAALAVLALISARNWRRHGGTSRRYLALAVALLAAVSLISQAAKVAGIAHPVVTAVLLVLFMGSAYAVLLFRNSLVPLNRWTLRGLGAFAVAVTGGAIAVNVDVRPADIPRGIQLLTDVALLLGWCLLVGVSISRLWRVSGTLPAVQRARLRALNAGFSSLIVAIVASAAVTGAAPDVRAQIIIEGIVLLGLPLLVVAFVPPRWLRRSWRQREEVRFHDALNDLLLYSPDVVTLGRRGLEWPSRLLGGYGSLIALDGSLVAFEGLDEQAAQALDEELEERPVSEPRSVLTAAGPVAVMPLVTRAGSGHMAVLGGPFTPLFGDEELQWLEQYCLSITVALDRVHLVEGVRRNAQLLDLAHDAVFTWGFESRGIRYWNRAAADMYGHRAEEVSGRDPQALLQTEFPAPPESIRARLVEQGHWEGELVQTTSSGQRLNISARWALQRDAAGRPETVLEINSDITEMHRAAEHLRRARDEAERASLAKSEYLSRMSHELRTPLAAMIGFSDLLELRDPRDDQKQAIDAIQRAGAHLLSLVNDVLDIARIDSGRETLELQPIDVRATLEECHRLVSPSAADHGTTLRLEIPPGEHLYVRADRQRLIQVLLNLLTNAIKYGGEGGSVRSRAHAVEGDRVEIEVIDDGPGLDADARGRLFQPFERLGAERSHVQGTGLGLALARQVTTAMGGEIGVRSEAGAGSAFWVRLHGATAFESASLVPAAGPPVLRDRGRQLTVLYVEDNLATIAVIESIFALRPDLRLMTAMQGGMGIELAREHLPALVILDLHLPDLDGDEVMRRLREDPRTADIPVVMYSADATTRQVERLLGAGAAGYLTKPARVNEFLQMLDTTLPGHREPLETTA